MADRYLYSDRVPTADLKGLDTAAQALEALRVDPPDRFSYVEQRARYDGYFDEGRALGVGIAYRIEGAAIVLRVVQPDAPAGRAGLQRGDRIVAIGGVDASTLIAGNAVSEAFGPSEVGAVVELSLERAGRRFERSLAKDWYTVSPVLASRVIESEGARVGYVALHTFTEPTRQAWRDTIDALRQAGARTLVVDLRDNGGGRLFVAAEVAASLAPVAAIGQPFTELRHNARHAPEDLVIGLPQNALAGSFDRVAWLVSEASCSASESLIAGLRPYRDDPVIGTATCGKPVGFEPQTRGDTVLSVVTFVSRNRDGLTDWFAGLAPTCAVADEPYLPLGDPADPRLAEALRVLANRGCSGGAPPAKSAPNRPERAPPGRGLTVETGLW